MAFFEFMNHIDQQVFLFINGLHCAFFDSIMWEVSKKTIWIPLYLVLVFFMIRERKWDFLITALFLGIMIFLSDQGADLIKDSVQRLRPTHNPVIGSLVHYLHDYKGGQFGFVSSHASNAFAVAGFTALFFKKRWFSILIFFWALLVSYSRMYLGVHYPLDVTCGGLLGLTSGILIYYAENWAQKSFGMKEKRLQQAKLLQK